MDATRFDRSIHTLAQATGRRGAMRSLSANGLALLAALGLAEVSAKAPHTGDEDRVQADGRGMKKRKTKRGPAGPAGPAGPTGPAGVAVFKTREVRSEVSQPLPAQANTGVTVTADCGGEGKVLSCGYEASGDATQLVNVVVLTVHSNEERSVCFASLLRTSANGAVAGGKIRAFAICLD
jgi:hypothetical protein